MKQVRAVVLAQNSENKEIYAWGFETEAHAVLFGLTLSGKAIWCNVRVVAISQRSKNEQLADEAEGVKGLIWQA